MNESYEVVKERNEKNRAFRKQLKNFYIGRYGIIGVLLLGGWGLYMFADSKTAIIIGVCVLGAIFVAWILWCVFGGMKISCPHCDKSIVRSNPWNIRKCPYCGTSLEIVQYFEREKL